MSKTVHDVLDPYTYSEAEFQEGYRLGKPCLVYMRDENVPILPKFMEDDPEKFNLLKNFKKILNAHFTSRSFKDPDDLAHWVTTDLSRIAQNPITGDPATLLERGADAWNIWRAKQPAKYIDLKNIDLHGKNLRGANLSEVNLSGSYLYQCDLRDTNLSHAILKNANLSESNLSGANLRETDIQNAELRKVDVRGATLIGTIVQGATISGSLVHGTNIWDLQGEFEKEDELVVTPLHVPSITVNNIYLAQLIYLLMNHVTMGDIINTLTSKSVLLLGDWRNQERTVISVVLRNKLLEYGLLPIVSDFDPPLDRNFIETTRLLRLLVGMSYFVIADVSDGTDTQSQLLGLASQFSVPIVPIIEAGKKPEVLLYLEKYLLGSHRDRGILLDLIEYESPETLLTDLKSRIVDPAIAKQNELRLKRKKQQY